MISRYISLILLVTLSSVAQAETMTLPQVLQRVVDEYPSVKSAALQVARAREQITVVEGQLGWQLNGNAGYTRDTNLFGTANDIYSLSGGLNRGLKNGDDMGMSASLSRTESDDSFAPTIPNPADKARVELNYRHRLEKGSDNPAYTEGLQQAEIGDRLSQAQEQGVYDQLTGEVIELYLSLASTQARISNLDNSIKRSERLQSYINSEYKLGLSEQKDVLQVRARLSTNEADRQSLQVLLQRQVVSLNRLMGRDWQRPIEATIDYLADTTQGYDALLKQSEKYNAGIKVADAQILLAESGIRSRRDLRQDQLDLVMFIGNEINQGDVVGGSVNESEVVGGVSLQYQGPLDKSGVDAQLRQAHYDRDIALEEKKRLLLDLRYQLASLLNEISASEAALKAFEKSVKAEQKKLNEAMSRYRDGRIETDQVIDYESQLSSAELSYQLQRIELVRRYFQLDQLQGKLTAGLSRPAFNLEIDTTEGSVK